MKLALHNLRTFLLLLCFALGLAVMNARPAQAQWKVSIAYSGTSASTPLYNYPLSTPSSYLPTYGLNGLTVGANTISSNWYDSFYNHIHTVATLTWDGASYGAPSSINVTESLTSRCKVQTSMPPIPNYGAAIDYQASLSTGATPTLTTSGSSRQKTCTDSITTTYAVPYAANPVITLTGRDFDSNLVFDWSLEPDIPSSDYPSPCGSGWGYGVFVNS